MTEEKISFQNKNIYRRKKFLVKGSNFLSEEDISSQMNKFSVIGRFVYSDEEIYGHRKKFIVTGRNLLSEQEIFL